MKTPLHWDIYSMRHARALKHLLKKAVSSEWKWPWRQDIHAARGARLIHEVSHFFLCVLIKINVLFSIICICLCMCYVYMCGNTHMSTDACGVWERLSEPLQPVLHPTQVLWVQLRFFVITANASNLWPFTLSPRVIAFMWELMAKTLPLPFHKWIFLSFFNLEEKSMGNTLLVLEKATERKSAELPWEPRQLLVWVFLNRL